MKYLYSLTCLILLHLPLYGQDKLPWNYSSPEEQGMNSITLINGIKKLKQENVNIHSLLIIRNDRVVLDAYFFPFQKEFPHDLASVTKSITALLIGIAIDKGYIKDDDQPVVQFFPEYKMKNDTAFKLRIKDLLNMSSGFKCSWFNGEQELKQMNMSEDWVKFIFELPCVSLPGERFSYCSSNYYLLAEILQRSTKMTCLDFAKKYLFQPLNFGETYWENNDKGVNHGWGDLFLSTYDLAKIGCLVLKDGKWDNKQIISKDWIEKIKPQFKIQGTESYGYGWWLDSENPDEFQAVGRGGQRLFIFKNRDIVIATTGGGFEAGDIDNLVLESISAYDINKDYSFELDSIRKSIQYPSPDSTVINKPLPLYNLNKDFRFKENELKVKSVRFEIRSKDLFLILTFNEGLKEEHPIGMNNEYLVSKGRLFDLPVALKSSWENDKFIILYNELCGINLLKLSFTFSDSTVDLIVNDQTDGWTISLKGNL